MSEIEIYLNFDKLDKLIENLDPRAEKIVEKIAFQVEAVAKTLAPVDTGALMNSIYTSTKQNNTPPNVNVKPGVRTYSLPNAKINEAYVGPSVDYGIYQEFGHFAVNGVFVPAHPYLFPALFQARAMFNEIWKELFV
jgi:hypothetical protein